MLAYPVPQVASEILDLAGRWTKERVPQRHAFTVGTHLRENRKGRTGADAATVLHAGVPGFAFGSGETWGVHTGWSGNHTHYAERMYTGDQVLGGGELLLPGEIVLGQGESYTSPWLYGSYGIGLDAVARRFHRFLRARRNHPSVERPVTLNVWEAVYFDHRLEQAAGAGRDGGRPSAWSGTCWTTAGSAPGATTTPAWATGRWPGTSGRTGCTPWLITSAGWGCSSGCGSSPR